MPCLKVCFSVISVINVKHVIYDAIYMRNMTFTFKHFHVKADIYDTFDFSNVTLYM